MTTHLPIDHAYYEIVFNFDLKDSDGFTLKKLNVKADTDLESGTRNVFQATVDEPIDFETAMRVHDIWVYPYVEKCISCLPPVP